MDEMEKVHENLSSNCWHNWCSTTTVAQCCDVRILVTKRTKNDLENQIRDDEFFPGHHLFSTPPSRRICCQNCSSVVFKSKESFVKNSHDAACSYRPSSPIKRSTSQPPPMQ